MESKNYSEKKYLQSPSLRLDAQVRLSGFLLNVGSLMMHLGLFLVQKDSILRSEISALKSPI